MRVRLKVKKGIVSSKFKFSTIFGKTKKGISPVVATSLLLVVAVSSVAFFQGWFSNFSSSVLVGVEQDSAIGNSQVKVENLVGNNLYVNSGSNLSIKSVSIGGVDCNINGSYSGLAKIDVSSCIENSSNPTAEVIVVTEDNILESYQFIDNLGGSDSSSESGNDLNNAFVSIWNTSISGSSGANQIELPLEVSGSYNFVVTGDNLVGSPVTVTSEGQKTLTFSVPGVNTISIEGEISGFRFDFSGDYDKILDITFWGPLNLGNNAEYFEGCGNLVISATDSLNLSGTDNLSKMFSYGYLIDGDFSSWDVSLIKDMSYMFASADVFNGDISSWDVSSVTTMNNMFSGASLFNRDISGWDTSSVVDMKSLFNSASSFNQNVSGWNTDLVTDMSYTFFEADDFNYSLDWDTGSVTTMSNMFAGADVFNGDISGWNTTNVLNMGWMFFDTPVFNQDISSWNTSKVTNVGRMFRDSPVFAQDLSGWDMSAVTISTDYRLNAFAWNCNLRPFDLTGGC